MAEKRKEKTRYDKNSLNAFLKEYSDGDVARFHMPGHKGSRLFKEFGYENQLSRLIDFDITEINGADNLFKPESIIRDIMNRYKDFYEVRETFLSVGGSSAGLIASILAAAERGSGTGVGSGTGRILMGRNCHKSVYNGAILAGLKPAYLYPEIIEDIGIAGSILPEDVENTLMEMTQESEQGQKTELPVVVITSPNYYGITSDIEAIAEVCHKYDGLLIVDQAHGAHMKLFSKYCNNMRTAEEQGADIVVNSTHKTLASFGQTGIINLCTDRVPKEILADKLQMIQSSSPSYMFLSSFLR